MTLRIGPPMPIDVEADIAHVLFMRDLEPARRHFWPLEAAYVFDAQGSAHFAPVRLLEEIDARWRDLNQEGVRQILNATPKVAQTILAAVAQFPPEERDWAYAEERERLCDWEYQQRKEEEFNVELLGARYAEDIGWAADRLTWIDGGQTVRSSWERWLCTPEQVARWTPRRHDDVIQRILLESDSIEHRLEYAALLCKDPRGERYGKYLKWLSSGPVWRAKLLFENDVGVLGPLAGCSMKLEWREGFIVSAEGRGSELPCLLAHPGSFALGSLALTIGEMPPRVAVRLPRLKELRLVFDGRVNDDSLAQLLAWLNGLIDRAALTTIEVSQRRSRTRVFAALAPLAQRVRLVDAYEGEEREFDDDDDD